MWLTYHVEEYASKKPSLKSEVSHVASIFNTAARARASLLAGFVLAILLVVIILLRYPGNAQTAPRYIGLGVSTISIELVMAAWVVFWGTRPRTERGAQALRDGTKISLLCGILWLLEISFNNIIPPDISTGTARFYVDNGFWLAIMLISAIIFNSINNHIK